MLRLIRILCLLPLLLFACNPSPVEPTPAAVTVTTLEVLAAETANPSIEPTAAAAFTDTPSPTTTQAATPTLPPSPTALPQAPSLIFHNGAVLSMEAGLPVSEAIAVQGNLILSVGSEGDILSLAGPETQVIDLQGSTLMPGFVDPHTHLLNDAGRLSLSLVEAQDLAFENGITTIGDMFVTEDFLQELVVHEAVGGLRLRTSLYLNYTDNCGGLQGDWFLDYPPTDNFGERLRIGGTKIFTDGGSCGPVAASQPASPGESVGELFLSDEQLLAAVAAGQSHGYQVVIHAIGDLAIEQAQNAIEGALAGGPNLLRHRIDHNAIIPPALLSRYSEIGIVTLIWGHYAVCDLGPRVPFYQDYEWPWRALLDANPGLHIAWHGDDPWIRPISPILELYNMVTRQEVAPDGSVCTPPDWLKRHTITVEEALPMMTTGAAYALFREDELGELKPGLLADLIVLSANPLAVDPDEIKDIQVWMTMVDGKVEYCASGREAFCP
jgi:predicted amidohydrolase YtcJ